MKQTKGRSYDAGLPRGTRPDRRSENRRVVFLSGADGLDHGGPAASGEGLRQPGAAGLSTIWTASGRPAPPAARSGERGSRDPVPAPIFRSCEGVNGHHVGDWFRRPYPAR